MQQSTTATVNPGSIGPNDTSDTSRAPATGKDQTAEKQHPLEPSGQDRDETKYPERREVAVIMLGLYLVMFLLALDRTIIATAVPQITNDFHSLGDVGWYASSYMLTACAFQLVFGKIYTFYSPRLVLLASIALFEIGSLICGTSPNSIALIIGRAVAGSGAAGIFTGVIVSLVHTVPLRKRPIYVSMLGAIFMVSSVIGPLMGGAFTSKLTWRWCFYINLPIGAVTVLILVFVLKLPNPKTEAVSLREQFTKLDPLGNLVFIPGVISLLLALKWGGSVYSWNSSRIIILLVLAGVLLISFIGIQLWKQEDATVPPRIINQRTIAAAFLFSISSGASMTVMVYYLPLWFQAVKGADPVQSGVDTLPFVTALVVASIVAGGGVSRTGYCTPFMIVGTMIASVGAGMISTFLPETSSGVWIGYQVLYGFGLGLAMQQAGMAAQTVLSKADIPIGASLMTFGQQMGGSIFVSIASNIFTNELVDELRGIAGLDPATVVSSGATEIRTAIPLALLQMVVSAYNLAVRHAIYVAIAMSCASLVCSCFVEFKSVKGKDKGHEGKESNSGEKI